MSRGFSILLAAALLFAWSANLAAADPTAAQIIAKSKEAVQAKSAENKVQMTLVNKRGDTLVQKMVTRTHSENGLTRQVTTFLYPDETKGTKFLVVENDTRDDDMHIFIPALKRIRTISSSQRNQSYMGTDFSYGDLEALDPKTGQHAVTGSETIDGQDCYVVTSRLDPKTGQGYSKIINWYRKDEYIPIRTEYFDKDGAKKKIKTVPDLYKDGDAWVLKKMVMEDVQRNHQTIIEVIESTQKPVDASFFTKQFLLQTDRY